MAIGQSGSLPDIESAPFVDADSNGLSDIWEEIHFYSAGQVTDLSDSSGLALTDSDGDGAENWEENAYGTDPFNLTPALDDSLNFHFDDWDIDYGDRIWFGASGKYYELWKDHNAPPYWLIYAGVGTDANFVVYDDEQFKVLLIYDKDSDSDGVTDWEEALLTADPAMVFGDTAQGSTLTKEQELRAGLFLYDPFDHLADFNADGKSNADEVTNPDPAALGGPVDVMITEPHDPNLIFWIRSDIDGMISFNGATDEIHAVADLSGYQNHARHMEGTWNAVTKEFDPPTSMARYPTRGSQSVSGHSLTTIRFDGSTGDGYTRSGDPKQYLTAAGVEPGQEYTVSFIFKSGNTPDMGSWATQNAIWAGNTWETFTFYYMYKDASHWCYRVGGTAGGHGFGYALYSYGPDIVVGEFSLITFTRADDRLTLYVNGQFVDDKATGLAASDEWGGINIGDPRDPGNGENNLDGDLLEVRVYDEAMSSNEVISLTGQVWRQYGPEFLADTNEDEIPDFWEAAFSLQYNDPGGDFDNDGITNRVEGYLGTDPTSISELPDDRFATFRQREVEAAPGDSLLLVLPDTGFCTIAVDTASMAMQ